MGASALRRFFPWHVFLFSVLVAAALGAAHRGALVALSLQLSGQPWFFFPLVPAAALRGALVGTLVGLGLAMLCGLVLWSLTPDGRTPPDIERHRVVAGRACALVGGTTLMLLFFLAPEDELLDYLFDGGMIDLVLTRGIPAVLGTLAAWWVGRQMAGR
jgi:hypothetical protein